MLHGFTLAVALLSMACGDCISIGKYPLIVTVADARTGQSVLAGATIIAVGGARSTRDSILVPTTSSERAVSLACCSGGTYTVIVRRPGYLEATRDNIDVATERCGQPKAETVDIRLTPIATAMAPAHEPRRRGRARTT